MLMTIKCTGLLILKKICLLLRSDIDKISEWCEMNKMTINIKKCKIMRIYRITRKKSPLANGEYNREGQPLESVDMHND